MENLTFNSPILEIEGLKVTQQSLYPVFVIMLLIYMFVMVANVGIIVIITLEKSLHEPMYILFCNLPFNDVLGNTILIPRLLTDLLKPEAEKLISYAECVVQAVFAHLFGTTSHTILMIMAFDRYVAICNPLRYATIMSNRTVVLLSVSAWGVSAVLVAILLGLTIRLNRCRTLIANPYCDNASLFKLSCENVAINNVYGLMFSVVLLTLSMGSMALTYSKITAVCLSSKSKGLSSKALQTCSSHLTAYLVILAAGGVVAILHRFPEHSEYRKPASVLLAVIPGVLNPLIYGIQSKEIRYLCLKRQVQVVFYPT
uniref:G-protein coupled receptors family 1 profile domain-containing protein n=1 Tax=Denticeps clupeoides TaxID=299321 RepID=A0AAY4CXK9_9TELE